MDSFDDLAFPTTYNHPPVFFEIDKSTSRNNDIEEGNQNPWASTTVFDYDFDLEFLKDYEEGASSLGETSTNPVPPPPPINVAHTGTLTLTTPEETFNQGPLELGTPKLSTYPRRKRPMNLNLNLMENFPQQPLPISPLLYPASNSNPHHIPLLYSPTPQLLLISPVSSPEPIPYTHLPPPSGSPSPSTSHSSGCSSVGSPGEFN